MIFENVNRIDGYYDIVALIRYFLNGGAIFRIKKCMLGEQYSSYLKIFE